MNSYEYDIAMLHVMSQILTIQGTFERYINTDEQTFSQELNSIACQVSAQKRCEAASVLYENLSILLWVLGSFSTGT